MANDTSSIWENGVDGTTLTASNLNIAYDNINLNTGVTVPYRSLDTPIFICDNESNAITAPEPPCNNLGDFLLRKYNGA